MKCEHISQSLIISGPTSLCKLLHVQNLLMNGCLWALTVLYVCCIHMLHRLNTCTGIKLEIKFHPVSADVVGLGCHLAGIGSLSLVVTCMTLVGGILRHMGETRKGGQFHLRDSGMA